MLMNATFRIKILSESDKSVNECRFNEINESIFALMIAHFPVMNSKRGTSNSCSIFSCVIKDLTLRMKHNGKVKFFITRLNIEITLPVTNHIREMFLCIFLKF